MRLRTPISTAACSVSSRSRFRRCSLSRDDSVALKSVLNSGTACGTCGRGSSSRLAPLGTLPANHGRSGPQPTFEARSVGGEISSSESGSGNSTSSSVESSVRFKEARRGGRGGRASGGGGGGETGSW